ncbi:MAG TPA: xylose isomerase [Lentisphaeria bacterium]|nr:MAG: hypothetical protein A2X45_11450 [Lentisphaerae bacterium GWF2_50_93]HCE44042.1 xylose isomerase [Lentisphaeria bacterium]
MKIGVITDLLQKPLFESISWAAGTGVEGVQLYAASKNCNLLEMELSQLHELKAHCNGSGLLVSAVCGDLGGHGFQIASENTSRIKTSRQIIDVSKLLGCRIVTMHIGVVPASRDDQVYKIMLTAMQELGSYAAKSNAVVAIETGPEPAAVLKQFLDDAGTEGLGVNLDPANLIMVLNEDPVKAVHILKDHIVHTHAKDGIHYRKCAPAKVYDAFARGGFEQLVAETGELFAEVPLGKGSVNWDSYIKALDEIGFDGFLTIEREVGENPEQDIKMAIEFLRHKISKLKSAI